MQEQLAFPLVEPLKKVPGLLSGLIGLSADGFRGASVGTLHDKLTDPRADYVAAHPDLAPLINRVEVLDILQQFIRESGNPDLLVPALVEHLLDTEPQPQTLAPLTIATGFSQSILLGGPNGLLKLPNQLGADYFEVVDVGDNTIAEVSLPEAPKIDETKSALYTLQINGSKPGKTTVVVRVQAGSEVHTLLIPILVTGTTETQTEPPPQLLNALANYTLLPLYEQKEIAATVPQHQTEKFIALLRALWHHRADSCFTFTRAIDISPYHQNLILLNIPNLGLKLTRQAVHLAVTSAMDKRNFDGDRRRMQKYGVDKAPVHESSFPLSSAFDANRNVGLATIKYLNPKHIAQLIGIDLKTFVTSDLPALMEIRSLLAHLPGMNLDRLLNETEKLSDAETFPVAPEAGMPQIFVDSVIARALPDLLTQQLATRSAQITFPFDQTTARIDVTIRNSRGQFITRKKITSAAAATLILHDLPFAEKVQISAVTTSSAGVKRELQSTFLEPTQAKQYVYGVGMPTRD